MLKGKTGKLLKLVLKNQAYSLSNFFCLELCKKNEQKHHLVPPFRSSVVIISVNSDGIR